MTDAPFKPFAIVGVGPHLGIPIVKVTSSNFTRKHHTDSTGPSSPLDHPRTSLRLHTYVSRASIGLRTIDQNLTSRVVPRVYSMARLRRPGTFYIAGEGNVPLTFIAIDDVADVLYMS
ncbi:hypothetical protein BDN67DRAFT_967129 [Paxillus ammoniavirescens]|nr:hypothetical protein BDN67DRAFT_967129 [Paxillus ammoniavirescens]